MAPGLSDSIAPRPLGFRRNLVLGFRVEVARNSGAGAIWLEGLPEVRLIGHAAPIVRLVLKSARAALTQATGEF